MILKDQAPVEIAPSVFWLGIARSNAFLQSNAFLIMREEECFLIDPGPAENFESVYSAFISLTDLGRLKNIVLTSSSLETCSSLPLWEAQGFSGIIISHWRSSLSIQSLGVESGIARVSGTAGTPVLNSSALSVLPLPFLHEPGSMGIYDSYSRVLFSGALFGALGRNVNLFADKNHMKRMVIFHQQFMPSESILRDALEKLEPLKPGIICPQHGSIISENVDSYFQALRSVESRWGFSDEDDEENEEWRQVLEDEVSSLKQINFNLQENLIRTNDEKIRDNITGLYNSTYFNSYLPVFMEQNKDGTIVYLRLDNMRSFNNTYGYAEGDNTLEVFTNIVLDFKPPEVLLFRAPGPVLAMVLPDSVAHKSSDHIRNVLRLVEESDSFIDNLTCSAAMISVGELVSGDEPSGIKFKKLMASRIKVLDRMGRNSICLSAEEENHYSGQSKIMIVESEQYSLLLLKEYFEQEDYIVVICSGSSNLLHQVDLNRPDLIISELHICQSDAFRIRKQLLQTEDLKDIPFILISHLKTDDSVKNAFQNDIVHYFKKPVSLTELGELVKYLVRKRDES